MDGAAGLTQCPIPPGQSFTYRFWAVPVGTHWYHSHQAAQRLDGLFGMFIVHPFIPTVPYFPIFVNDWSHVTSEELELGIVDLCENGAVGAPYRIPGIQPGGDCSFEGAEVDPTIYQSSLLGGRNRWQNQQVPLAEYVVKAGRRYRFRMVHSGHAFPFEVRIDGHRLNIVATDGSDIQPIQVDSFFILEAERVDFEIVADQSPGRYWMRAETQCPGAYANAIIAYDGIQNRLDDPNSLPMTCTAQSPCVVFNCPFGSYPEGSNRTCIPMAAARSTASSDELRSRYGIGDNSRVIEYFLNVAMVAGASINGRRFMMPSQPPFQDPSSSMDCVGEPCLDGCSCRCANKLTLPFGRTIQLVITNLQPNPNVSQHL